MYFVAVDVGCIECGEDTSVLGIFTSYERAEKVCKEYQVRQKANWHGQHEFKVYTIETLDEVYPVEYRFSWEIEEDAKTS